MQKNTKPVDNVVIATKGLQDRTTNITAGTTVENKGKLILTKVRITQKIGKEREKSYRKMKRSPDKRYTQTHRNLFEIF